MRRVCALALAGSLAAAPTTLFADAAYLQSIARWRQDREQELKGDNSWLTVAGLFFLNHGRNTFGSGPLNDIVLPAAAPAEGGVLEFDGRKVTLHAAQPITVNGAEVKQAELKPAGGGKPADTVKVGPLSFFVHKSGDRFAIRLRDLNSEIRRNFTGLRWFPADAAYKVTGRFEPYPHPWRPRALHGAGRRLVHAQRAAAEARGLRLGQRREPPLLHRVPRPDERKGNVSVGSVPLRGPAGHEG
jgi:uncharacterized protein (DUF1684 family)